MGGYFDHNATTPLDPRVLEAMLPWLTTHHGNPSSSHLYGREASAAVEQARQQVAYLIVANPRDIVFTSSGSEANNTIVCSYSEPTSRFAVSSMEHPSILVSMESQGRKGAVIDWVVPEADGRCSVDRWDQTLSEGTSLAILMLANNEIGTIQPVREVAAVAADRGVPVLCDAVQAVGKIPVSVEDLGVDYLVLGGHKFHGPGGTAAAWIRPGSRWTPLLLGGSQETGRRASTVNVASVVGLGAACELVGAELAQRAQTMSQLRDLFEQRVKSLPDVVIHGAEVDRLPNTSSVAFLDVPAQTLMIRLDMAGFAVSMGSACGSGKVTPSATLQSMEIPIEVAGSTLRFSFASTNTEQEVESLSQEVIRQVQAVRRQVSA